MSEKESNNLNEEEEINNYRKNWMRKHYQSFSDCMIKHSRIWQTDEKIINYIGKNKGYYVALFILNVKGMLPPYLYVLLDNTCPRRQ